MTQQTELEKAREDLVREIPPDSHENALDKVVNSYREAAEAEIAELRELLREVSGYFPGVPESEIIRPPSFNVEAPNRSASLLYAQKKINKLKATIKQQAAEIERLKGDRKRA